MTNDQPRSRRKFSWLRVSIGALIFVAGLLLQEQVNEFIGAVFLLAGVLVGIPGSIGLVTVLLFMAAYIGIFVGYFYWAESDDFGPTFGEWLSGNWWIAAYMAVLMVGGLLIRLRASDDAWKALAESYPSTLDSVGKKRTYPTATGVLNVDADIIGVSVVASELGIFIVHEDESVHLPWERVEQIVFDATKPRRAVVHVSRKLMNPLVLDLPWHEAAMREIPATVAVQTYR